MVILAAAITTKTGKPLLSRQYREMSRVRIEGLLTAFPKLAIGKGGEKQQHTFVETDTVRYVYQPMELIFVILITTKNSNIVEDLETLQTLAKVVKEIVGIVEEEKIFQKAYDILFAFDELISLGYPEAISLEQVKTFLEMDSQTENLQNMIMESKMNDARQTAKQAALDIAKRNKDNKVQRTGISKQDFSAGASNSDFTYAPSQQDWSSSRSTGAAKVGSLRESPNTPSRESSYGDDAKKKMTAFKLVPKKKQQNSLLKAMVETGEMEAEEEEEEEQQQGDGKEQQTHALSSSGASSGVDVQRTEAVQIKMDEKINAELSKEGNVQLSEVKGEMFLKISDPAFASIKIQLDSQYQKEYHPNTHPNIDKKQFTENAILGLRNNKSFPVNNELKILTWKLENSKNVPLSVSCWPNPTKNGINVVMQYELKAEHMTLQDVSIIIPFPPGEKPAIDQTEQGTVHLDSKNGQLTWNIDVINSDNGSGSLEFTLDTKSDTVLFPIQVQFTATMSLSGLRVTNIVSTESNDQVANYVAVSLSTQDYTVVNE